MTKDKTLADLVYDSEFERAIELAKSITPRKIHSLLFLDDGRHREGDARARFDEFLRRWYATLDDPYLRAHAAEWFADTYLTELAPVPHAEYIGANWRTESLRSLIAAVSEALRGWRVNEWVETPDHPLPAEYAKKWRAAGQVLAELDLPPVVPPINPDPPEHHRTTTAQD